MLKPLKFRSAFRQQGFALLEIIIGTVLMGVVLAFALGINTQAENQVTGRSDAQSLSTLQSAAAEYYLANRPAIDAAMQTGVGADTLCLINVNPDGTGGSIAYSSIKKTCAFDASLLVAQKRWPVDVSVDSRGGRYVAILRTVYDSAPTPAPTGVVDMLVVLSQPNGVVSPVSPDPRLSEELASGMNTLGSKGGMVPVGNMGSCVANRVSGQLEACGTGWKIDLAEFIDDAQLAVFAAALPN